MNRFCRAGAFITVLLLLAVWGCAWGAPFEGPMAELEERRRTTAAMMEAATVWVVVEEKDIISNGSGFLVADGCVMTNAHVVNKVRRGGKIYVLNESIPMREAAIVDMVLDDPGRGIGMKDFALLRFTPPKGVKLPTLSFNLEVKRMDMVSAWGYPAMVTRLDRSTRPIVRDGDTRGLTPAPVVYTEGTVSTIVNNGFGSTIIHSANVTGGNSGGPLVNSRGEVVGINTWRYMEQNEGASLNLSIMANDVVAFLRSSGIEPRISAEQSRKAGSGKGQKSEDRRRNVGRFSVTVPEGWSVTDEEKDMIFLNTNGKAILVGIISAPSKGASLSLLADVYAEEFGAEPFLDGKMYRFNYTDKNGTDTMAFINDGGNDTHILVFISGDPTEPGVMEILDSLERN
ncbi:MAG: serine protease [Synergistaceae bacterium]|nr:serine protease [Synergistaceae bacterium]